MPILRRSLRDGLKVKNGFESMRFLLVLWYTYFRILVKFITNLSIMHEDHLYNLMSQVVTEHRSLWRIKKHYIDDCEGHEADSAFWNKMIKDKEEHIKELTELIKAKLS